MKVRMSASAGTYDIMSDGKKIAHDDPSLYIVKAMIAINILIIILVTIIILLINRTHSLPETRCIIPCLQPNVA